VKKVGICFPARSEAAGRLAHELRDRLHAEGVQDVWMCPAWDDGSAEHVPGTDLLLCVGGDGTVLWGARSIAGEATLLLGVNMGRLGFLTEMSETEIRERLGDILRGAGRVEPRAMLQAEPAPGGYPAFKHGQPVYALNDVVVSRGGGRPVLISVAVDGTEVAVYHCDAVIVATATGSTGYALSAGGPILHPESRDIVVAPVAVHFSQHATLVLPSTAEITLTVHTEHRAILSVDGQDDIDLFNGSAVRVWQSPHSAHFLRLSPPSEFYENLSGRLAWLWAKEGLLNNREP
jgi:NAD+ kinase